MNLSPSEKAKLIEYNHPQLSVAKQAELLGVSRSTLYYQPKTDPFDKVLINEIDKIYTKYPFYGKRRICVALNQQGFNIGIKKTRSLMEIMGIQAIYPKPKTTIANIQHKKYPYLLRNKVITKINEVWSTDITYIRLKNGWIYLVAIIDWYSRYVLSWEISITLEDDFCITALRNALKINQPEIFNSDQGVQFTSNDFTAILEKNDIKISMDGRGRCLDNIFVERLWRTVKYEEVYLKDYETVLEARQNLKKYFDFYNNERPHQSMDYRTPAEVYRNQK